MSEVQYCYLYHKVYGVRGPASGEGMHRDVGGIKLGQYFSHEVAIGEVPGAAGSGEDAGGRTSGQQNGSKGASELSGGAPALPPVFSTRRALVIVVSRLSPDRKLNVLGQSQPSASDRFRAWHRTCPPSGKPRTHPSPSPRAPQILLHALRAPGAPRHPVKHLIAACGI